MIYNQTGSTLHSVDGKKGGKEQELNSREFGTGFYVYTFWFLYIFVYQYIFIYIYIYYVSVGDVRATASDQDDVARNLDRGFLMGPKNKHKNQQINK